MKWESQIHPSDTYSLSAYFEHFRSNANTVAVGFQMGFAIWTTIINIYWIVLVSHEKFVVICDQSSK